MELILTVAIPFLIVIVCAWFRIRPNFNLRPIPVIALAVVISGSVLGSEFFNLPAGPIPITLDRILVGVLVGTFAVLFLLGKEGLRNLNRVDFSILALMGVLFLSTVLHDWKFLNNMPASPIVIFQSDSPGGLLGRSFVRSWSGRVEIHCGGDGLVWHLSSADCNRRSERHNGSRISALHHDFRDQRVFGAGQGTFPESSLQRNLHDDLLLLRVGLVAANENKRQTDYLDADGGFRRRSLLHFDSKRLARVCRCLWSVYLVAGASTLKRLNGCLGDADDHHCVSSVVGKDFFVQTRQGSYAIRNGTVGSDATFVCDRCLEYVSGSAIDGMRLWSVRPCEVSVPSGPSLWQAAFDHQVLDAAQRFPGLFDRDGAHWTFAIDHHVVSDGEGVLESLVQPNA